MSPRAAKPKPGGGPALAPLGTLARAALAGLGRGALAAVRSPELGKLVLSGIVVAGIGAASWRVRARVLEQPGFTVDRRDLSSIALPPFLSERARADLAALDLPEQVGAFEPTLVPGLADRLRRLPWVESVASVRLDFDGEKKGESLRPRLRFALKAARPIARIRERGLEVIVARSRRRIPTDRAVSPERLPRIDGLPEEGYADRERILDEALSVIAALEAKGLAGRIGLEALALALEAAPKDPRGAKSPEGARERRVNVTLVLAGGARVDWGPASDIPGLPVRERLDKLEAFATSGPGLETVERLSLRWDDPVYVLKPVTEPPPEGSRSSPGGA